MATAEHRREALRLAVSTANATGYMTTEQMVERANGFTTFLADGVPVDETTISDEVL